MPPPGDRVRIVNGLVERRTWDELAAAGGVGALAGFLQGGGVVVFPTESSYALGADPLNADGVETVFRLKCRSAAKALPVVLGSVEALPALGIDLQETDLLGLAGAWPGPLSLILPCARPLPASGGRRDLAVRVPGHDRLRDLLSACPSGLTATSANLAGEEPILEPDEIVDWIGHENLMVIDEGRLAGGPPSTMVRIDGRAATVLRFGAIGLDELRRLAPTLDFNSGFSADAVEIPVEDVS